MSDDTSKADTIAFHFYTKLFYTVNHARATEDPRAQPKMDKWFNLETPDSDLFTREVREPYRTISQAPLPGPPDLEIQVLLSVPELTNNQALVYMSPDSTRVRIEPTPRFILLETWTLGVNLHPRSGLDANADISPPVIYKHGIILFRSVFSLLRVLPAWRFYKRLKRKIGGVNRNGHLSIQLRVRPGGGAETDRSILGFDDHLSPTHRPPLPTSTHTFPPVPHLLGSFTLSTTYLVTPDFQLDELESLLSSRFISLDLEGFIPTLDKNRQRDSLSTSSLPTSSGIRSVLSRSPPKATGMARTTSGGGGVDTAVDNPTVADRFILPTRVASIGTPSLGISANIGNTALIPPPRPFPTTNPSTAAPPAQPIPASGLAVNRLRRESLTSSSSSSISTRDNPYPTSPFSPTAAAGTTSRSASPISGALPIRRPNINPVHPFKSNTLSSASGSSPSLSIRQGATGPGPFVGGSPVAPPALSGTGTGISGIPFGMHSRQSSSASPIPNPGRLPPSPMSAGFSSIHPSPQGHATSFTPSSLGDRRPGTSGSGASSDRDRRISMNSVVVGGDRESDDGRVPVPMPPPRKRYSSSFGHRYVSSVGSGTGIVVAGSGSGLGLGGNEGSRAGSTPGSGSASGMGTPASVGAGGGGLKKESITSLLGVTTDDDDISIFVQHIDERKPLSSREKERQQRDQDILEKRAASGAGHDLETTDTMVKGKQRAARQDGEDDGQFGLGHAPYTTSPPPISAPFPHNTTTSTREDLALAAYLSTSPNRGPMLTSQDEVEERLKKMNETFLKSLEGIDGSIRRKERQKSSTKAGKEKADDSSKDRPGSSASSTSAASNNASTSRASRGLALGPLGFPSASSRGSSADAYPAYPYNTPGLGLGIGLGRQASASSSMMGNSDAMASQGSEEVIGRMELYEERRRSGYQGP